MKQTMTTKTIDINSIYHNMREAISRRNSLQSKQDELWRVIKRTHTNHSSEMSKLSKQIGVETHKINGYISSLCKYKKTHSAMKLANDYLSNEISRIEKIIKSKKEAIRLVRCGRSTLIRDTGTKTTDTSGLQEYVNKKESQLNKLKTWKEHVSKYRR